MYAYQCIRGHKMCKKGAIGLKISKEHYYRLKEYARFDEYIYKKLSDTWYLCRLYRDKKSHPIGYHILVLIRLKVR